MDYRRISLIILFTAITGWLAVYVSAHYLYGIFILIAYPMLVIIPYISLIFAFVIFFMTNKWFSAERLLAVLLLLPILLTAVIPQANMKINLHKEPDNASIRSYFESIRIGQPLVLDLSGPISTYNDQNKILTINIKVDPERYVQMMDEWEKRNAETSPDDAYARVFMNILSLYFVHYPKEINELTLRPRHIIVHGYWGDELLLEVHYTKIKDEYIVVSPSPKLSLIEEDAQGFLVYQSNDNVKKIKVYEGQKASSSTRIDLSVY